MNREQGSNHSQKREDFQKKRIRPNHKSRRNVPEIESEKKGRATYALTKTAQASLKALAKDRGCSVSSLVEDIARDRYVLISRETWQAIARSLDLEGLDIMQYLKPEEDRYKP